MRGALAQISGAIIAATVAIVWIFFQKDGESLLTAFRLPDVVAVTLPDLAIGLRRLVEFQTSASPAVALLIDFPAGVLIFLVLDLPGALLLWAAETTWGEVRGWNTLKPLWAGLAYAVMAATFLLTGMDLDWPILDDLTLSPIAVTLAALFAGAILGLTPRAEPARQLWDY